MTSRVRRLAAAAAVLTVVGLGVAACSAGTDDASSASGGSADVAGEVAAAPALPEAPADAAADGGGSVAEAAGSAARTTVLAEPPGDPRSLIRTGNVALRATDVDQALFEIGAVLQKTGGEVAEENTTADDDGESETSLITARVPVDQFDTAITDLKDLGSEQDGIDLVDSSVSSEDVSTKVIDVDVRVELQKRSIERISVLLDRATSIRDIVSIERELAGREADLGSLQQQQTFLADQTSMSTITISVERPPAEEEPAVPEDDRNAFVAGLADGWDAFGNATSGLLTVVGALLPFAVLALVIGVPVRVWWRRRRVVVSGGTPSAPVSV